MSTLSFFSKFFKYLKWCNQGGYTQILLSRIQYPEIFKGKRILITGGSDGIGLAIAKKFVESGGNVMITGRNVVKLQEAKVAVGSDRLHSLQWDVTDIKNMDSYLRDSIEILEGLDVLINNAAFLSYYNSSEEYFDRTINTNVKAVYYLCQKVGEIMHKNNGVLGGKILNISSINAFQANTHPYFISKRAVNAITEGFAKKYAPYNIIVNAIAPGYCDSSINRVNAQNNAYREEAVNKRITIPDEIAELAIFLCSGAANGIVGQTILCDGGTLL